MDDFLNYEKHIKHVKVAPTPVQQITRPYSDKVALVAIAKNEDHYIEEWIQYYLKLGVDNIYIYQNNWRIDPVLLDKYPQIHAIPFDGTYQQLPAYNNFIQTYSKDFGWGLFFDVDEFLALTKYNNIKDWLNNYNDYGAIGVNWRLFGDNGLEKVVDNNYSVIERFTKADKNQFHLIKTIINFNKPHPRACFKGDPHHIDISLSSNYTINTKKTGYIKGPRNYNYNDPDVQLNHYFCKTLDEFLTNKALKGSAMSVNRNDKTNSFISHNKNDIEDLTAYNFFKNN
jgi:hypothetical protein